jgi:hypothetical protein
MYGNALRMSRFEAGGRNFALREECETMIDHIVGENAALGYFAGIEGL